MRNFKITSLAIILLVVHLHASAESIWEVSVSEADAGPSEMMEIKVPVGTCYSKLMQRLEKKTTNLAYYEHACVTKKGKGVVITGAVFDERSCSMVPFKAVTQSSILEHVFGPLPRPLRVDAKRVPIDKPLKIEGSPGING